jgi:hypothetical protein
MTHGEALLRAGAVLPPGTEGAGERAVPLTARRYRHPGLDGRVVVRLAAAELGAAEDLAASYLGLEPDGEPAVVGLGARRSLGFPEWVLAHHPGDGHHALAVVPELERAARQARTKPKAALDAYHELARRLGASVPHFLPTFYEQAGRVFLGAENTTYAAQMFAQARRAEAEHGLGVDEDRLDEVFLEFALAGALPVKVLSGFARELASRVSAEEALRRFTRLCVRRTAGGLAPSAQAAGDLRRLARAAGADADVAEQDYLAEVLGLPATTRAATGWWKAHRASVAALARRRPETRRTLLSAMPQTRENELPGLWLEILDEAGALVELPLDDAAAITGWLERFLTLRDRTWGVPPRLPALYRLVERVADPVRAELARSGGALSVPYDVDLLDLLLALDIPVADPAEHGHLQLAHWAKGEGRRDLLALAADLRFRPAFHRAADGFGDSDDNRRAVLLLAESPGGRVMLAEWMRAVALRSSAAGLPELPDAMRRLAWLPGQVLALAEEEVRRAATADIAAVLARTLRGGLFDELGWPAWEEAAACLVPSKDIEDLVVADAWPHLIVAGAGQARVLDADGAVLTHDLRLPRGDTWSDPGFHYVDGELLVYWQSRARDGGLRGYWHTSPDHPQPLEGSSGPRGTRMDWYHGEEPLTLPLPGGGRTTGHGVLHAGDTAIPEERQLISDGTSYWVWTWEADYGNQGWYEYDPIGGRHGRMGRPAFLAEALRTAPPGSEFHAGMLAPAPSDEPTPVGTPAGGLFGWRVVRLPDGSWRGEDVSGRTVTLPGEVSAPVRGLTFPGDDRPRSVVRSGSYQVSLADPDGVITSQAKTDGPPGAFGAGTPILPPIRYWHCLRPRDPRGSAALRRADRDVAAALLEAGPAKDDDLRARIREVLPEVTHDALVSGIAGVVRFAASQRSLLSEVVTKLTDALDGVDREEEPSGPADRLIIEALSGLGDFTTHGWHHEELAALCRQISVIGRALADDGSGTSGEPSPAAAPPHLDPPLKLSSSALRLDLLLEHPAALAYRAVSPFADPEHRETLRELLARLDGIGAFEAGPPRWRRMALHLDQSHVAAATEEWRKGGYRGVLPLGGGALVALLNLESRDDSGFLFTALFHDPSGRFEVPPPYTVRSSAPAGGAPTAGWAREFLAEPAGRGPAPWHAEAADAFAGLTGVSQTTARLVVAGLPQIDGYERAFLGKEARAALGVKVADAAVARDQLRDVDPRVRRAVVAALLPADPARLWAGGPDAARAAEAWNAGVGRQVAIPEWLLGEASRAVRGSEAATTLRMLVDPAAAPELTRDLAWTVRGDRARPTDEHAVGFTADTLVTALPLAGWLAHRLPAGDPMRAALPAALGAVRERLAAPGLMLDLGRYVDLPGFRKAAGAPTEVTESYERYGAVVMPTYDDRPAPGLRVALLGPGGDDPYLRALIGTEGPFAAEAALRVARDPRFAALLADPGDPAGGGRDADGTWWPHDPSRSVPELVTEAAKEYDLGDDAAALYLMLLAMPDPADRNVARWTGWKSARLKAANAELAGTDLVVEAVRRRAGRSLFLPGGWTELAAPRLPLEQWKLPLFDTDGPSGLPIVPSEPAADLYTRAWRRVRDGDVPRFEELKVRRARRR